VTIRAIRPDDRDALRAGFHKLSPQSRYRRFQGHVGDLSAAMLRYLTEVDGTEHFAIVAVLEQKAILGLPHVLLERWRPANEIVGVARIIRLRGSTAEIAITVADALQGRGFGADLFKLLVEHAHRSNIDTLVAHVLPDNAPMLRLLRAGGDVTSSGDGTVTVSLGKRPASTRRRRRTPRAFRVGRVNFVLAVRWLRLTSR
jgi:RimJ/RimL family protein N-acetyltransferase